MMPPLDKARPSLGFGDELDNLDPADWTNQQPKSERVSPEVARIASEAAGFRSREATMVEAAKPPQRRRRTGRNAQLNIKTKPETIEEFTRIADANGWGLGETFERATTLLQKEQASR